MIFLSICWNFLNYFKFSLWSQDHLQIIINFFSRNLVTALEDDKRFICDFWVLCHSKKQRFLKICSFCMQCAQASMRNKKTFLKLEKVIKSFNTRQYLLNHPHHCCHPQTYFPSCDVCVFWFCDVSAPCLGYHLHKGLKKKIIL